ncbi:hypothetical protein FIV38_19990 [Pseudomonas proteolytica]|nr:hypothetical protein F4W61_24285 [Pseudomonas proteolytica]TWR78351.1 hypothetical protein FIV38_19990 [Pseudomonas proteolytica]
MCGSWLACDADTSVYQRYRGDAIAGKPAPTQARSHSGLCMSPNHPLLGNFFWPTPPNAAGTCRSSLSLPWCCCR